jgi:adenylosuccinate synthase
VDLNDPIGAHLAKEGQEFGATTGRARRCGWLDAVSLRRSAQINSLTGICLTKMDVLDGIETLRIAVGYERDGVAVDSPPIGADAYEQCKPKYIEMPGWKESTIGIKEYDDLPENARAYIKKIEEVVDVPIDVISTGPDRKETIILRHPFK